MAEEIRLHITVIMNKIFFLNKMTAKQNLEELSVSPCPPPCFISMCSRMIAGGREREQQASTTGSRGRKRGIIARRPLLEGWFCFRNWNVSRLDFYFQFTFQIQLPKLFDLSPCLLTRKRTLGLLSWELGAHVESLARIHIPAKFSHTKGPAREKKKG